MSTSPVLPPRPTFDRELEEQLAAKAKLWRKAQEMILAFHAFRNRTEDDWDKYEGSEWGDLLDTCMDLECTLNMENDDEE